MGTGIIDPELGVREGWVRDQDNEVSFDGYNAFIAINTHDGTSGFSVKNDTGSIAFQAKSDGDGYFAKNVGIGTYNPTTQLEVIGKTKTSQFQIPTGAVDGYILTCDSQGNAAWRDAYVAGGGISAYEHRTLDQLVHLIAENSFEEVSYQGNRITAMIIWTDSSKTTRIRDESYTYGNGNEISTLISRQYNASGIVVETLTENYTWANGRVINITRTLT